LNIKKEKKKIIILIKNNMGGGGGGHKVVQLVEALCYNQEGRGFDSRWCHWNFS